MARQCYTARASSAPCTSPRLHPELPAVSFHPSMGPRPRRLEPARVSLILPGLVWPGSGIGKLLEQLTLPALSGLLGRSRLHCEMPQPWLQWLSRQFGVEALSWAALRLGGEKAAERNHMAMHTLCADPVSLSFSSDALLLRGPRELALTSDESAAILSMLNKEFSDIGEWISVSPMRFYLLSHENVGAHFHPLPDVLGRPVAYFPAEGEKARNWNRIANELQIALHNHPINQARSENGQLAVNGLWLWGEAANTPPPSKAPSSHLHSTDQVLRGLARSTGMQQIENGADVIAGLPGHTWMHDARLQEAAQDGDIASWLIALQAIENTLIQPLCAAWQQGRISEINLLAPCDKILVSTTLKRSARWLFWRKPMNRARLSGFLQAPTRKA